MRRMRWITWLALALALTATIGAGRAGGGMLDGFEIGHVPGGVGATVSDFSYEWEDVAFASRVWEHATPDGGHAVDLTVIVLRGDRLTDADALRDFLAAYHECDPATWRPTQIGNWPGFMSDNQLFWLVQPGVAVDVRADPGRFRIHDLLAAATSIRPAPSHD
ncbi:hypothetical protein J5X84_32345 [Streptosporangiaceae bacterium NEAU-GS5]|nr:hypothetical protein [Streptosporangiaceae bacterium NEAU-GS5]